jgi:NADPH2:quinone reductase
MKAIVFHETGAWTETLRLVDHDVGDPGANEVQVRVVARPINPSDRMFVAGNYRLRPRLPQVAGLEGAGVVERVGRDLDAGLVGQHVAFRAPGTWAERINLPIGVVRVVPDAIPFEVACQLSLNLPSAYGLLERAGLRAGQWLLLTAANSSVGRLIMQLARLQGIRVLALVRRPENLSLVQRVGADAALLDSADDLLPRILDVTAGGANAALDAVGGRLGSVMFQALAPSGVLILYGRLSPERTEFAYGDVIYRNLRIEGFGIDQWQASRPAHEMDGIWTALVDLVASGRVVLSHDKCFALEEYKAAIAVHEACGGKVILTSGDAQGGPRHAA